MRRALTLAAACVAIPLFGFLLYRQLERYSLEEVIASLRSIPLAGLARAGGFAAASYLCLTGFDALAVRYAGYRFPYRSVAIASFASLSIGHNIGVAALSSGAVRYRFYSKLGMSAGDVGKVIVFCGLTVAIGLLTLGGTALLIDPAFAAEISGIGRPLLLAWLGGGCLALVALYTLAAAFLRRTLRIREWSLEMPPLPLALGQIALGTLNFACVAACLHAVLSALAEVDYAGVATVYVIGNTAGIASHVPGGLGVLESVVMYLLPESDVIGALLAFRAIYYFVPLALGGALFAIVELVGLGRERSAIAAGELP